MAGMSVTNLQGAFMQPMPLLIQDTATQGKAGLQFIQEIAEEY